MAKDLDENGNEVTYLGDGVYATKNVMTGEVSLTTGAHDASGQWTNRILLDHEVLHSLRLFLGGK